MKHKFRDFMLMVFLTSCWLLERGVSPENLNEFFTIWFVFPIFFLASNLKSLSLLLTCMWWRKSETILIKLIVSSFGGVINRMKWRKWEIIKGMTSSCSLVIKTIFHMENNSFSAIPLMELNVSQHSTRWYLIFNGVSNCNAIKYYPLLLSDKNFISFEKYFFEILCAIFAHLRSHPRSSRLTPIDITFHSVFNENVRFN